MKCTGKEWDTCRVEKMGCKGCYYSEGKELVGNSEDISMILVSAERYALGRRTYIVQWTCEVIIKNLHLIVDKDIEVMIRDIEQAISYGDDCDKKEWMKLLKTLKERRDNR